MVSITFIVNFYYIYGWYYIYGFITFMGDTSRIYDFGQCKTQTADCRLQTGGKMQTEGKMQTADQG